MKIQPKKLASTLALGLLLAIASSCNTQPSLQAHTTNLTPYKEIPTGFSHIWDETTHPFTGASVIDIDGDGKMEIFIGGGNNQPDAVLRFADGKLSNIIQQTGLSSLEATYGSTSIDMDSDGDVDLLVAREDGLHLCENIGNSQFTCRILPVELPKNSVVFDIAVSDIDQDKDPDLYLSIFVDFPSFRSPVFNDPEHAKSNILLLNNGDLSFTDITKQSNTAGTQNTFLSVFTDLNNDGWQDLVLAQNTGQVEIFQNNQDLTFSPVDYKSGFGFWMGIAVGDVDKDGDQDLFFSNIGKSIPGFLTKGDLQDNQTPNSDWLLLRNDGDFRFTDITKQYALDDEGFGWGAVFEDLNLDGNLDLAVAQNYIKWPVHKLFKLDARSFLQLQKQGQSPENTFVHQEKLGLENPFFGQSPLVVDFNQDGKSDLLWINMDGPVRALMNQSQAKVFNVLVPEAPSLLGTRVYILTNQGKSYTKEVMTSVGLMSDQSPRLSFALGEDEEVKELVIIKPDGRKISINQPKSGIFLPVH